MIKWINQDTYKDIHTLSKNNHLNIEFIVSDAYYKEIEQYQLHYEHKIQKIKNDMKDIFKVEKVKLEFKLDKLKKEKHEKTTHMTQKIIELQGEK